MSVLQMESFCMSMSYQLNQLWVGDKCGKMHLFDPRHGDFSLIQVRKRLGIIGII